MSIKWFNEKPKIGVATLTDQNITLNKAATSYFENAYSVMLGISEDESTIVIKPLDKSEAMRHDIPDNKKYRITVRSSYSRVSNKAFMQEISEIFNVDLADEPRKYPTSWDKKEHILMIQLRGSIK